VEAVALIVQIHLQQNRNDLAVKEVAAARRWAQDSLLVNLAESWVGLRFVSWLRFFGERKGGFMLTVRGYRAARSTSRLSTSTRSWRKHRRRHQCEVWSPRL
jgi:hypothetical protein